MPGEMWDRVSGQGSHPGLEDVRARLLQRGTQHVEAVGLSLGINAALVEQLAREAGVTTRQFAQVWASAEAFLADLFCELANQARIDRADTQTLLTTWQYLGMRVDDLHSPKGRRGVLIDVIRTAAEYNFDVVTASSKWRTYAALSTTILSWPEGEARDRVLEALRASELSFVETMESFYRNVLPTVGYRLKPVFHNDYQPFVIAAASVIEGLGIVRATVPALVEAHFEFPADDGEHSGGDATAEAGAATETWSVAALSFIGVVDAFIEPDPEFVPEDAIARLVGGVDVTPQAL
ncbi:hypothetical protein [Leucobacter luti]|uniref:TetR family transcriptional regulator n=1 Tax=Leucobacter luti TaxID=340320 RepID=A0A4Q7TUU3_9MICO|nr:hypothetical protein [Leucobacter luti]MBL3698223.1 hypothetical protein [Leucobacter luti]RZT64694.1 hypothetical protein EV139_2116 [Leucobacter luti]